MADAHSTHDRAAHKVCKTCGESKPYSEFAKAKSCLDGYRGSCKKCLAPQAAKRAAKWRERHPDRAKEVDSRYKENNPERVKQTRADYYQKHADLIRAKSRDTYANNKERAKKSNAAWIEKNNDRHREKQAAWRAANKDKIRASYAKWGADNKDIRLTINRNRRARLRGNGGKLSKGLSEKLYKLQGGKCACCGHPLGDSYHLDHIMPLALGGKNEDCNMQLLRAFCNLSKKAKHPIDYMQSRGFLL